MTTTADTGAAGRPGAPAAGQVLGKLELDTRLLGMIVALLVIWISFGLLTGGTFLSARNLWNLAVQTSVVGVMACGMVLVIVTRNIDLSVGSLVGLTGMVMAFVQVEVLPQILGLGHPLIWVIALAVGLALGALVGAFQGVWIAYAGVPAFIVTLGGLLIYRGAAWWVTSGRTVAPLDDRFQLIGGGINGSIGATWSWIVGAAAIALILLAAVRGRVQRRRHGFPVKPMWAEILVTGAAAALVVGFVMVMNAYTLPERTVAIGLVDRLEAALAEAGDDATQLPAHWQDMLADFPPEAAEHVAALPDSARRLVRVLQDWPGLEPVPRGIPIPVLILIGVAAVMTFVAKRTRFGRYVFAIGGNPEAANLAGVNTRRILTYVFIIMGVLAAVASAIATARLDAGANSTGTLAELSVIAAAVIGGTSLGGGVGTIVGALLGALVMQSLQSGMAMLDIDTPLQNIVIGVVLVVAVWIDTLYQKRRR